MSEKDDALGILDEVELALGALETTPPEPGDEASEPVLEAPAGQMWGADPAPEATLEFEAELTVHPDPPLDLQPYTATLAPVRHALAAIRWNG